MVDIEFSSLHSSKASMTMMHGGNVSSRKTAPNGSTMSFFSCLDGRAYATPGFFCIASDMCFFNVGLNNVRSYAMVRKMRSTLLHSASSLEQKNDPPSSPVLSK